MANIVLSIMAYETIKLALLQKVSRVLRLEEETTFPEPPRATDIHGRSWSYDPEKHVFLMRPASSIPWTVMDDPSGFRPWDMM